MRSFLAFTLVAPFASFGEIAVGERRGTWERPGKSAVLGLVGAALGLTRDDADAQWALADGYFYAVRTDASGRLLADYHTAQTASEPELKKRAKAGYKVVTRADELALGKLETILSRRDYRTDALHTAALAAKDGARWTLDAIDRALKMPIFTLYLGRKSCPLALPLAPRLVTAIDAAGAFTTYDVTASDVERTLLEGRRSDGAMSIAFDPEIAPEAVASARRELRRDALLHRGRWQFGLREEVIFTMERGQHD
jgi:CRISPR system Cascade subunit CasD